MFIKSFSSDWAKNNPFKLYPLIKLVSLSKLYKSTYNKFKSEILINEGNIFKFWEKSDFGYK